MSKEQLEMSAAVTVAGLFVLLFVLTPEIVGVANEILVRLGGMMTEMETQAYRLLLAFGQGA